MQRPRVYGLGRIAHSTYSRYVLLLEDMARSTPLRHPDYQPLITALEKMKTVAQYVNERKRDSENLQNVLKIQNILTNYNVSTVTT